MIVRMFPYVLPRLHLKQALALITMEQSTNALHPFLLGVWPNPCPAWRITRTPGAKTYSYWQSRTPHFISQSYLLPSCLGKVLQSPTPHILNLYSFLEIKRTLQDPRTTRSLGKNDSILRNRVLRIICQLLLQHRHTPNLPPNLLPHNLPHSPNPPHFHN
jgi:hypothetical protein